MVAPFARHSLLARLVLIAAVVAVLLAACGDDDDGTADSPSTDQTDAEPSSSVPPPTSPTTGTSVTTGPPVTSCTAAAVPADATTTGSATTDVNGDGQNDTVTTYETAPGATNERFRIRVQFGGGGETQAAIGDAAPAAGGSPRVLGAAEVGGDPGAELFVVIGSGASDSLVGVYSVRGCEMVRLVTEGSTSPAVFSIGGTVTRLNGLRCDNGQLHALLAETEDGITYRTRDTPYALEGVALVPGETIEGTLPASDDSIGAFSTLACEGVARP